MLLIFPLYAQCLKVLTFIACEQTGQTEELENALGLKRKVYKVIFSSFLGWWGSLSSLFFSVSLNLRESLSSIK